MPTSLAREMRFDGVHCTLAIQRFLCGVVVLKISGTDVGEFGDAPMLELEECLKDIAPIRLFIDARDVRGASIEVSGDWAGWLQSNKSDLRDISMLTGSRYIEVTAEFVRRFAALQGIMRIYTEPSAFDAALSDCLAGR